MAAPMTRDDAIKQLEKWQEWAKLPARQALQMAIDALTPRPDPVGASPEEIEQESSETLIRELSREMPAMSAPERPPPSRHEHEQGAPLTPDCDRWCEGKLAGFVRAQLKDAAPAPAAAPLTHMAEFTQGRRLGNCPRCFGTGSCELTEAEAEALTKAIEDLKAGRIVALPTPPEEPTT